MDLLAKAERLDSYRASCKSNFLNNLARAGQRYETVPSTVQRESEAYLQQLSWVPETTRVITLHPSADNGFPHTRPHNIICLPTFSTSPSSETLRHEALHVHQRFHKDLWTTYSIRQGWWPVPRSQITTEWVERCRINPDTMMSPFWAWQDYYVPLPLFVNEWSPSLGECSVRWFDLRNHVLYKDAPPSFLKRYGDIEQPEHPFETGAIEFSRKQGLSKEILMNSLSTE
jgi:hypothetical protein